MDYNGLLLYDTNFRLCFVLMNSALFCASTLCLVALLLVSSIKLKLKLTKYYAIAQLLLAITTLLFMGKLWFAPPKLDLDPAEIATYTYQFGPDSNGAYPSLLQEDYDVVSLKFDVSSTIERPPPPQYKYSSALDRLQQALGCCGVWSATDWARYNQRLGLLAPSCCSRPRGPQSARRADLCNNNTTSLDTLFYCSRAANEIGCQRVINENELAFVFRVRIVLLVLLALLFVIIITLASLGPTPPPSSGTTRCRGEAPPAYADLGPPKYMHLSSARDIGLARVIGGAESPGRANMAGRRHKDHTKSSVHQQLVACGQNNTVITML